MKYRVIYQGFLQQILRTFDSYDEAVTWARQAGVFRVCKIVEEKL